jgi:glycosyltransferase involved in cell wall biosynthesis
VAAEHDVYPAIRKLSVVVPVYNGAFFLDRCLDACAASSYANLEVIVIDDASTDASAAIAERHGAKVVRLAHQSGPGTARNVGAGRAKGEILFFVDADVMVHVDAVERAVDQLEREPDVSAVFGSYDDSPAERNLLSQYKNLQHHFVHQTAAAEASTFWGGCGAIRRSAFEAVGGFDAARYPRPSIEDIELGYRLRARGYRIRVDKGLQGKHLKRWTLGSWLRADILSRAIPWSMLILDRKEILRDLNLKVSDRVSAGLIGLSVALLAASLLRARLLWIVALLLLVVGILNRAFYAFLKRRRGLWFVAVAVPLHFLYFFYSGVIFVICWLARLFRSPVRAAPGRPPSEKHPLGGPR